jgi:DNA invertase Pin-like site-specific DNA recombinase
METRFGLVLPADMVKIPLPKGLFQHGQHAREVLSKYGPATAYRHGGSGAIAYIFEGAPSGTGVVNSRISTSETKHGQTMVEQVKELMPALDRQTRTPRLIVLTERNSGITPYLNRIDYLIAMSAIQAGWCRWVAYAKTDRYTRRVREAELFTEVLRSTRTELHLADVSGGIALNLRDAPTVLQLQTMCVHAEFNRNLLIQRTADARDTQWLLEGKGWPGTTHPGFHPATRDDHSRPNSDIQTVLELFKSWTTTPNSPYLA